MTELQRQMARYLRQRGAAVAARELAERFLRLECDEETGRRLLAPVLEELPGVRYEEGSGWRIGESVPAALALWWDDFISVAAAPAAVAGDRPAGGARIAWVRLSGGRAVESGGAEAASGPPPSLPIVAAGPTAEIATLRAWLSERPGAGPLLPISRLERAVGRPVRRLRLDEEPAGELDLAERARSAGRRLLGLAPELEAAGLGSLDRAAEALRRRPGTDFSRFEFGPSFLRALPPVPGVYRFVDAAGRTFYVGKTRNLRSRVRSYFRPSVQRAARVRRLLANLARVEFEPRGSEADALVDEQDAIRRGRPAGNRQMRIREGQASALGTGRWAVVAPSASGGAECSLFFLVEGRLASRLRSMTAGRARRIERALVRTERVPASQRAREAGEQLRRWVAARPREFSVLRLDEPPGTGEALKLIVRLLRHYEVERGKVEVR